MTCHALIYKISDLINIFKQSFTSAFNEISAILVTRVLGYDQVYVKT